MAGREKVAEELLAIKAYFAGQTIEAKEEIIKEVFVEAQQTIENAISLLKEQEPKPELPVDIRPANERFATMKLGYCPKCGKKINSVDHKNYCGECGQEVKWNG